MKKSSTWRKFKLLMWKNILIRKRNWFAFFLELLFPIVIFILFALTVQHYNTFLSATIEKEKTPPKIDVKELNSNFNLSTKLCYYPAVQFTKYIIKQVQSKLKLDDKNVLYFNNESSFLEYFGETYGSHPVLSVAFQKPRGDRIPRHLIYRIRPYFKGVKWNTAILIDHKIREHYELYLGSRNYIETGFLSLQIALETSFIEMAIQKPLPFDIVVQEFPYPQRIIDPKITIFFDKIFPLLILLVFMLTIYSTLSKPTYEKRTGIKELMKTTGLSSWLIFIGWFSHHITVNVISILFSVIFLTVPIWNANEAIINHTSYSILVIFFFLFCCSAISFGLLIASRFDNEITAQMVGLSIWSIFLFLNTDHIGTTRMRMIASIFPSFTVRYICKEIGIYEMKEIGAHWSNIHMSANDDTNAITISYGFFMLFVSCIIFSGLSLYIEQLYPGRHGRAKHYYFIIYYKAFWKKIVHPSKVDSEITLGSEHVRNTEPSTPNLKPGIRIKHLCKRYGKLRVIDNLSMNIYHGLITVVLGQSKAGKTTIISILTGKIKATSGKVFVYDEDIRYNINGIRCSLGYCPQNNIHFEDLNILDHFVFFGMLKGHNKQQSKLQAMSLLQELNLFDQRKKQAKQLSGGMQRRLSLGIALMGRPKVLIFDEPTSGLDSATRQELWNILLKLKKSRTIVITTQFVEEADALADRIAMIDHGKLMCYGTPMFLKTLHGSGYRLTLIRDKKLFEERNPEAYQILSITSVIKEKLNEATLFNSNLNCLTYLLPFDKKSAYSAVLSEIENNKEVLCITHIEMSIMTLEEVFIKAGSFAGKSSKEYKFNLKSSAVEDNAKFKSLNLQLYALLRKRWLIFKKRYLTFLISALSATILCTGAMHLTYATSERKTKQEVKLDFKLSNYGKTIVYYSTNNKTGPFRRIKNKYKTLVEEQDSDAYEMDSIHQEILNEGDLNFENYQKKMIVAAEFIHAKPRGSANAMFSNLAFHGSTMSVNLLSNSILQSSKCKDCLIESGIFPLPHKKFNFESANKSMFETIEIFIPWMLIFPIGLIFLVIPFMILPHMENSSKLKQLQFMCGVNPLHYWCIFYVMDLLFYFIWILIIIGIMLIYQNCGLPLFNSPSQCLALMVILMVYGMPVLPFTYLFSKSRNIFNGIIWYFIISILLPIILFALVNEKILPSWSNYLFVLYPHYGLLYLLLKFCSNAVDRNEWNTNSAQEKLQQCQNYPNPCCDNETSEECYEYFNFLQAELNEPIKCILIIIASTFFYFAILLILDEPFFRKYTEAIRLMFYKPKGTSGDDYTNREDVKLQQERISEIMDGELREPDDIVWENQENKFLAHNLEKSFKNVKTVKQISFGADAGECFGLLGVNGAGKTTTVRMLTGDLPVIKGECRILSHLGDRLCLSKTPKKYFSNIGYCPQHDVIEDVLTGLEMLRLFGRLRGISIGLEKDIQILAKCLGFDDILNGPCGSYNGGSKRKLNIAMALIGVPPVILLDEPTIGMDPVSRRAIWNTVLLLQNQKLKPAIVLTTQSLEECEVLCNKVAIMKAGEFHSYGTIPQLKSKYTKGFTVTLKLLGGVITEEELDQIQSLKFKFEEMYMGSFQLKKEHASIIQYHISDLSKKWSERFQEIEKLCEEFSIIEDYTITETTLEETFFKIAYPEKSNEFLIKN